MKVFSSDVIKERLKAMRLQKDLSLSALAELLKPLLPNISFDGENGKQLVSQLERGKRKPTIEIAFAYANIFNVTLDYVFGWSDEWQPQYKNVKDLLGLTDASIQQLANIQFAASDENCDNDNWREVAAAQKEQDALNLLLSSSLLPRLLDSISEYVDTVREQKIYDNMSENEKRARELGGAIKNMRNIESSLKNVSHQIKYATSAQRVIKGSDLIEFYRQRAQKSLSDILEEGGKNGEHQKD